MSDSIGPGDGAGALFDAKSSYGRYRVLSEIGRGSMCRVFLAHDPNIDRKVALKVFRLTDFVDSEWADEAGRRFQFEARAAGRLAHPNIVVIYDVGEENDCSFIAMEYVPGPTLAHHCRPERLLDPTTAVSLVAVAARALGYAHGQKIVHRDIKPANLILSPQGVLKITDFGLAKEFGSNLTAAGTLIGTPSYMSPEQVRGLPLDGRSDLFSLGAVLYELLTGEPPFGRGGAASIIQRIVGDDPPALRAGGVLPAGISDVLRHTLEKSPDNRYPTGDELADDLGRLLTRGLDYRPPPPRLAPGTPPDRPTPLPASADSIGRAGVEHEGNTAVRIPPPAGGPAGTIDTQPVPIPGTGSAAAPETNQRRDPERDTTERTTDAPPEPADDLADPRRRKRNLADDLRFTGVERVADDHPVARRARPVEDQDSAKRRSHGRRRRRTPLSVWIVAFCMLLVVAGSGIVIWRIGIGDESSGSQPDAAEPASVLLPPFPEGAVVTVAGRAVAASGGEVTLPDGPGPFEIVVRTLCTETRTSVTPSGPRVPIALAPATSMGHALEIVVPVASWREWDTGGTRVAGGSTIELDACRDHVLRPVGDGPRVTLAGATAGESGSDVARRWAAALSAAVPPPAAPGTGRSPGDRERTVQEASGELDVPASAPAGLELHVRPPCRQVGSRGFRCPEGAALVVTASACDANLWTEVRFAPDRLRGTSPLVVPLPGQTVGTLRFSNEQTTCTYAVGRCPRRTVARSGPTAVLRGYQGQWTFQCPPRGTVLSGDAENSPEFSLSAD